MCQMKFPLSPKTKYRNKSLLECVQMVIPKVLLAHRGHSVTHLRQRCSAIAMLLLQSCLCFLNSDSGHVCVFSPQNPAKWSLATKNSGVNRAWNTSGNKDSCGNENRQLWEKKFSVGKKSTSILFSLKIKMMDL